jgi:hypothetical protein
MVTLPQYVLIVNIICDVLQQYHGMENGLRVPVRRSRVFEPGTRSCFDHIDLFSSLWYYICER